MRVLCMRGGHDSSTTIINNGEIELFLKEERYSGKKKDEGLKYSWELLYDNNHYLHNLDYAFISAGSQSEWNFYASQVKVFSPDVKFVRNLKGRRVGHQHHLYHATSSFYSSGFDESLVVVMDSAGGFLGPVDKPIAYETQSVYHMNYNEVKELQKSYKHADQVQKKPSITRVNECDYTLSYSWEGLGVGDLYNTAPLSMGQTIHDCGKAMGLSSYGEPVEKLGDLFGEGNFDRILNYFKNIPGVKDVFCFGDLEFENVIDDSNYKVHADYCYEVQSQTSKRVCDLIDTYLKKTDFKNVCIGGGYGMNIINNYNLTKKFPHINFYFDSLCDDTGLSIGLARYIYRQISDDKKIYQHTGVNYHGLHHDVRPYKGQEASINDVSTLLMQNKSVGVFYGQAEAGQRALGNRSILFNALNPDAKEIINKVKKREWYRPFAAMVLEEDAHLYFDDVIPNPEMTVCFPVKSDIIPGVTHVDGTSRIQTIGPNHFLYELLLEFKKMSGHGILLNTSFNLAGKPLIETPQQALDTLDKSSLDYVWFFETKQLFKSTF